MLEGFLDIIQVEKQAYMNIYFQATTPWTNNMWRRWEDAPVRVACTAYSHTSSFHASPVGQLLHNHSWFIVAVSWFSSLYLLSGNIQQRISYWWTYHGRMRSIFRILVIVKIHFSLAMSSDGKHSRLHWLNTLNDIL